MKGKRKYTKFQLGSAVFMILALLWLTISIPFVYASQQAQAKQDKVENGGSPVSGNDEETNPFANSTEEKAPSNTSVSEEYLHDHHDHDLFISIIQRSYTSENAGTYIAFHGELLVPPPNRA